MLEPTQWWGTHTLPENKVGKLGCNKIAEGFASLAVDRFNLVDERDIAMDFEMRNEIIISMFGDGYSDNGMQEGLMVEEQWQAYQLGSNYRNLGLRRGSTVVK